VNANHHFEIVFFVYKGIISEGNRVHSVNDRMSYITLRSHCDIVLNMHAKTQENLIKRTDFTRKKSM